MRVFTPPVSCLFHVTYITFDFPACGIQQTLTGESIARQTWKSERPLLGRGQVCVIARPRISVLRTNELSERSFAEPKDAAVDTHGAKPLIVGAAAEMQDWLVPEPNGGSSKWQLAT